MFTKKGDNAVLAKLDDAPEQFREIGRRLHAIIRESAPRALACCSPAAAIFISGIIANALATG